MPTSGAAAFRRYWAAATVSSFGSAVTTVALPVLLVQQLRLSPAAIGAVNAAQFLPYALLGLVAGAFVDRWSRRAVLVWASIGRALMLGAIPALWAAGCLPLGILVALLIGFGACSVFGYAAAQSLLPRLVPGGRLVAANARLDQSDAAAQTLGPLLGGGLVAVAGAPLAIAVDAASYIVDAVLNRGLPRDEPTPSHGSPRLLAEVREGLAWSYGHRVLGPLALSTHVWFLANAASTVMLAVVALRSVGMSSLLFSVLLMAGGAATLAGASIAPAAGRRLGAGRAILLSRTAYALAWLPLPWLLATPARVPALFVALVIHGLAAGLENANEMALWQRETPDALLGRVNASRRAVNRTLAMLGAILGGVALSACGERAGLLLVGAVFAVAAVIAAASPLRREA